MSGWVKRYRKSLEWEWYAEPSTCRLFDHLILVANYKAGKWRGIDLLPGQIITGRHKLAEQTGLSERQIRTALKNLETTGEVTSKTTNKYSIITITNWEKYQEDDQQTTSEGPASDQHPTSKRPLSKKVRKKEGKKGMALEELSLEHNAEWLAAKRVAGKYLTVDEAALLEKFKNYCLSSGKDYRDNLAAYRNAFNWDNAPKKAGASWQPF